MPEDFELKQNQGSDFHWDEKEGDEKEEQKEAGFSQEEDEVEKDPKLEKAKIIVLQEEIGKFFDELHELKDEDFNSLELTGKLANGEIFTSQTLFRDVDVNTMKMLIGFFREGKTPAEIVKTAPNLVKVFEEKIITKASQKIKKEEKETEDDDDEEDEEKRKEEAEGTVETFLGMVLKEAELTRQITARDEFVQTARREVWNKMLLLLYRRFDSLEKQELESLRETGRKQNGNNYDMPEIYEEPLHPDIVKFFVGFYPRRMRLNEIESAEPDAIKRSNQVRRINERISAQINKEADARFPLASA